MKSNRVLQRFKKMEMKMMMVIVFVSLVSLIMILQLIFNLFFAKEYYQAYKEKAMNECFYDIKENYDGTEESIAEVVEAYEMKDSFQVLVSDSESMIYVSFDPRKEEKISLNRVDYSKNGSDAENRISPLEVNENTGLKYEHVPIPNVVRGATPDMSILRLLGTFEGEEDKILVSITLPIASIDSSVEMFTQSSFLISGVVLILGCILFIIFSRSVTKPIQDIEQASTRYANLDFSLKANEEIPSMELSSLARSINVMSEQLERNIIQLNVANEKLQKDIDYQKQIEQMRREFVGNVSHEMKTPLALLQLYAANLQNNVEGIDKNFYCETIIEETDRLNDMVCSMLDISAVESGLSNMQMEEMSISELTKSFVSKMEPLLEKFEVKVAIEEDIAVFGDSKYLEQAMKNYVMNAISHTEEGKEIQITLLKEDDRCVLEIYNEGSYIEEADIPYLWDSFYRVDKARVRSGKNVGLGLYIVKTIVEKHGGSYGVRNRENGVTFFLELELEK